MNRDRVAQEARTAYQGMRLRLRLVNVISSLLPEYGVTTVRARLYRSLGINMGERVAFFGTTYFTGSGSNPYSRLFIGDDSIIGVGALFNLEGEIHIGSRVDIAQFVKIYTSKHKLGPSEQRFTPEFTAHPVVIEDGVYVCSSSIVLPGVTIGRGSVVSANSVVNRDIPPNSLVSGVPAKVIKQLD